MIPLSIIKEAFPNQPRMQQEFAALVQQAEDLVTNLSGVAETLAANGGDITTALNQLTQKQPLNSILTEIGALPTDPGVPEQVQPGSWQIRAIDAADTRSLLTRQEADTRYLGGAHAAASATKLATARNIAITGDLTWSVTFDGSANVTAAGTLATANAAPGTFGSASQSLTATVDAKGRITALSAQTIQAAWASITGKPTTLAGYGITDAQPLDGDLTSLAAAAGTNTIYYRSATNTWSPVVIGTGISFTGGTLGAIGTGGTVTSFSFTNGGGISGTITNPTTTPALSLTLDANGTALSKLAAATAASILGATAAGNAAYLTPAQAKTVLAIVAADVSGLAAVATSGSATDLGSGTLAVARGGTGATATTGTGNNVLSASPTLTGTALASAITASGTVKTTAADNAFGQFSGKAVSGTGKGLIFSYNTGLNIGTVYSLDWDSGAARLPMRFDASSVEFFVGASVLTINGTLGNFANDAAAATGGVPVLGMYRNGSVLMQRIT